MMNFFGGGRRGDRTPKARVIILLVKPFTLRPTFHRAKLYHKIERTKRAPFREL